MQTPVKIEFQNMDHSAALEDRIKEKIAKLDQRFNGLIACRVVIEAAHHHKQKGRLYSARVDVTLPKGVLVVSHHPGKNPRKHDKPYAAMNNAFLAIDKKLARFKDLIRGKVKHHEPQFLLGVVSNLFSQDDYGFLATLSGDEVYFHRHAVADERFDELDIGKQVKFVLAEGEGRKGPQASIVHARARRKAAA